MNIVNRMISWRLIFPTLLAFVIVSCSKDDPSPAKSASATNANGYVDNWILDNMKYWYLWTDEIPPSPDTTLAPDAFFKSLLSTKDRFSWIQDNYQELLNSLEGINKEAGFEFVLYRESSSSTSVIAQLLYIKPNSPAEAAGLKRGDIITAINGTTITTDNYKTLLGSLDQDYSITYKSLDVEQNTFGSDAHVSLQPVEYSEDPNFLHKVITTGDKKIGYYVYNFFATGTDADETKYDNEMDAVFQDFKSQGITDLVLDLRFNSGGSEVSAKNLASLIAPDVTSSSVFFKREYNANIKAEILNDPSAGEAYLTSNFDSKGNNVGGLLSGKRVYILTSSRTASASELVINALKPYMDVFLIGDVTYGKNVGSFSLYEENNPKNTWGMQPIVVKAYNSLDQSDYSNGFTPNVEDLDNSIYLYPLGDERESLLRDAIAQITGTATTGRMTTRESLRTSIGHSLDFKRGSFNLIIQGPPKKN